MEQKPRILIYDRKEMFVLLSLAVMVAIFAFTLGVHLGKKVGPRPSPLTAHDPQVIETHPDQVPNRQELTEQSKALNQAVDENLNQELHDEVARTGVKLEVPRQVDLPKKARSENAGAVTAGAAGSDSKGEKVTKSQIEITSIPAAQRPTPVGKYTIQVGSFPALDEAKDQVDAIEALGLKPYLRSAEVKGKGKWFRIYLGGYPTRDAAEKAGETYRSQHAIDSFMVAKITEQN